MVEIEKTKIERRANITVMMLAAVLYQMFRMYCAWYERQVKSVVK